MTYVYHTASRLAHLVAALLSVTLCSALLANVGMARPSPTWNLTLTEPEDPPSAYCPISEGAAFSPKVRPEVRPARVSGGIVVDGDLSDAAWTGATRIGGFTEIQPGDQKRPPVCTEVWVGYDESALYVAFRAFDDDPSSIRASFRQRDQIYQDDWIGLILDTYGDAAQAYEIFANPYGIQGDLQMAATGGEDVGFDLVYRSDGRITDDGYQVEMAIPFSSLRFPSGEEHAWRLTFLRTRPRSTRQQFSWASVDRDDPCFMCQFGTLRGMTGIQAGTKFAVIPALVGSQASTLANSDDVTSGLSGGRATFQPSVNLRYNLTSSLAAEATVNPDFSQVESDAAQIDVNSTFALAVPERRPFFQEGSDQFQTWIDVVYTRSINAPIAAGKVTGRAGRTSVAFLSAVDEQTPLLLPFEEQSAMLNAGTSASNLLRVRRTFGENSYAGVLLTDRRLTDHSGSGTVVSADAKWQLTDNYRLETQLAVSDTREPVSPSLTSELDDAELTFDRGAHTAALDGETFRGRALFVSFDRNARHWNFDLGLHDYSPTFRAPNGFETRNDYRRVRGFQGYTFYFENSVIERLEPGTFGYVEWNHDGVQKDAYGQVSVWARLKGQTFVFMNTGVSRELFQGVQFEQLTNWNVNVNSNFSEPVRLGFNVNGGRSIFRSDDPATGRRLNASVWATLRPVDRFVVEPELRYASLRDTRADTSFFAGYVGRVKTSMQVTRELSLRLVTQYNHFGGSVNVEPLVTYRINPFSVFFVGSTHGYAVPETTPERPDPTLLAATNRQVFFKLQYLFRR